jgi:hypothetical protein
VATTQSERRRTGRLRHSGLQLAEVLLAGCLLFLHAPLALHILAGVVVHMAISLWRKHGQPIGVVWISWLGSLD